MRSAWRGEERNTSIPKRLKSKSAAPTAIISMAQQASPKVAGHTLVAPGPLDQVLEPASQEVVVEVLEAHGPLPLRLPVPPAARLQGRRG